MSFTYMECRPQARQAWLLGGVLGSEIGRQENGIAIVHAMSHSVRPEETHVPFVVSADLMGNEGGFAISPVHVHVSDAPHTFFSDPTRGPNIPCHSKAREAQSDNHARGFIRSYSAFNSF